MQSKGKIMFSVFFQFPRSAKSRIGLTFFLSVAKASGARGCFEDLRVQEHEWVAKPADD